MTRSNLLHIEGNVDEIQDGDYIKTSIGKGTLYVFNDLLRMMELFSTKAKANHKETFIKNGGIRSLESLLPTLH